MLNCSIIIRLLFGVTCCVCINNTHCLSGNRASLALLRNAKMQVRRGWKSHFLWLQHHSRLSGWLPLLSLSKPLSVTKAEQQWKLITFNAVVINQVKCSTVSHNKIDTIESKRDFRTNNLIFSLHTHTYGRQNEMSRDWQSATHTLTHPE